MTDFEKKELESHQTAVKSWWNSENTKEKWQGTTYQRKFETHLHYWVRQEKTLKFLDELRLPKESKILELGYGGAETALEILERGYTYYGLDISGHLCEHAKKKCFKYVEKKKAFFYEKSLEEKFDFNDNFFDVVIICGAIHYAGNLTNSFLEVKRVLKKNGKYIIGQGNMYTLNDLTNPRKLLKCIIWFITREDFQYSYSLSFRDMLLETKLKKFFIKFQNTKFLNSKFMTKYSNTWKYKIHKRMFSDRSMKKIIEKNDFKIIDVYGGPFLYSSDENKSMIRNFINNFLQKLLDKKIFKFLIKVSDNFIYMSEPNNTSKEK